MTSHITWRYQHSVMVYRKIKVWTAWSLEFAVLHFTPQYPLQCNPSSPLHITALHCHSPTASSPQLLQWYSLHCTHYTAPPLLHCTSLLCNPTTLNFTALHHYTASSLLHCTVLPTLLHHYSTTLNPTTPLNLTPVHHHYPTGSTLLHFIHCTAPLYSTAPYSHTTLQHY